MDCGLESRQLDTVLVDDGAVLVDQHEVMFAIALCDLEALCARPGLLPARRRADHGLDREAARVSFAHQRVERGLVAVQPRSRKHLVEEAPAEAHGAV